MACPSGKEKFFLGVKTVTHAPDTRNQYDAEVSGCAAYWETGVRAVIGDSRRVALRLNWEQVFTYECNLAAETRRQAALCRVSLAEHSRRKQGKPQVPKKQVW